MEGDMVQSAQSCDEDVPLNLIVTMSLPSRHSRYTSCCTSCYTGRCARSNSPCTPQESNIWVGIFAISTDWLAHSTSNAGNASGCPVVSGATTAPFPGARAPSRFIDHGILGKPVASLRLLASWMASPRHGVEPFMFATMSLLLARAPASRSAVRWCGARHRKYNARTAHSAPPPPPPSSHRPHHHGHDVHRLRQPAACR